MGIFLSELTNSPSVIRYADSGNFYGRILEKLVMKFSGGDIYKGERGINKDLHTLYSFSFIQVFIPLDFSW